MRNPEELRKRLETENCYIELNKNKTNIDIKLDGDPDTIIATLLTAIYKVKKEKEYTDEEFNEILCIVSVAESAKALEESKELKRTFEDERFIVIVENADILRVFDKETGEDHKYTIKDVYTWPESDILNYLYRNSEE